MKRLSEAEFLSDVAAHTMSVVRDDGVYRHLKFQQPKQTWLHRFEIVTWPGTLCFRGDVGTFVFSRLADMFQFFRHATPDGKLYINEDYWAEKLIASDCNGRRGEGVMRYDPDAFLAEVKRRYVDHARDRMRGMPDERRDLRRALEDEVLSYSEDGETEARRAADAFARHGFRLSDFWETNLSEYTVQFVWCLYAISWSIRQYDATKSTTDDTAA